MTSPGEVHGRVEHQHQVWPHHGQHPRQQELHLRARQEAQDAQVSHILMLNVHFTYLYIVFILPGSGSRVAGWSTTPTLSGGTGPMWPTGCAATTPSTQPSYTTASRRWEDTLKDGKTKKTKLPFESHPSDPHPHIYPKVFVGLVSLPLAGGEKIWEEDGRNWDETAILKSVSDPSSSPNLSESVESFQKLPILCPASI